MSCNVIEAVFGTRCELQLSCCLVPDQEEVRGEELYQHTIKTHDMLTRSALAASEKMPLVVGPTVVSAAQQTSTVRGTGRVPASCRAST